MIRNVMKFVAVVSLLTTVSCRQKEEYSQFRLDANNMVMPSDEDVAEVYTEARKKMKPEDFPIIEIENKDFDFGTINQGDKVEHIFMFKNTGKTDLIIIDARPSCGCTVPEWTKEPIKSGKSGQIKIIFNSAGKSGQQEKTVSLTTNTMSGNESIKFKVNILTKENSTKK
jgi:hypothetical protein